MIYQSTATTHGKHLVCPLCGSENCLVFRDNGADHDSFTCHNCDLRASKLAVEMSGRVPLCPECKKGLFIKPFYQQRGVYKVWFFECRTIGCSRAGKSMNTVDMFAGYEKLALQERTAERMKQKKAFEDAKMAALFQLEEKLKKERDGKK